jgi:hypothetical protein
MPPLTKPKMPNDKLSTESTYLPRFLTQTWHFLLAVFFSTPHAHRQNTPVDSAVELYHDNPLSFTETLQKEITSKRFRGRYIQRGSSESSSIASSSLVDQAFVVEDSEDDGSASDTSQSCSSTSRDDTQKTAFSLRQKKLLLKPIPKSQSVPNLQRLSLIA